MTKRLYLTHRDNALSPTRRLPQFPRPNSFLHALPFSADFRSLNFYFCTVYTSPHRLGLSTQVNMKAA